MVRGGFKDRESKKETHGKLYRSCVSADFCVPPHNHGFRKQFHMSVKSFCTDRNSLQVCVTHFGHPGFLQLLSERHWRKTTQLLGITAQKCAWTGWGTCKPLGGTSLAGKSS